MNRFCIAVLMIMVAGTSSVAAKSAWPALTVDALAQPFNSASRTVNARMTVFRESCDLGICTYRGPKAVFTAQGDGASHADPVKTVTFDARSIVVGRDMVNAIMAVLAMVEPASRSSERVEIISKLTESIEALKPTELTLRKTSIRFWYSRDIGAYFVFTPI